MIVEGGNPQRGCVPPRHFLDGAAALRALAEKNKCLARCSIPHAMRSTLRWRRWRGRPTAIR